MKKTVLLGALVLVGGVGFVVFGSDEAHAPTAFDRKVTARTATLEDWAGASKEERLRFAKAFVADHSGSENLIQQKQLRSGINAAVGHIKKRPIDPEKKAEVLRSRSLWDTAVATAEMLNWPAR